MEKTAERERMDNAKMKRPARRLEKKITKYQQSGRDVSFIVVFVKTALLRQA
jgi:hypothetical protein